MNKLFRKNELQFIAWFSGILLATLAFLAIFNLLPSELEQGGNNLSIFEKAKLVVMGASDVTTPKKEVTPAVTPTPKRNSLTAEEPVRIVIAKANVDITIRNPQTTNADYLDTELSRGVVRYPGSGMPGIGNMFIFGHSTSFSVVQNAAYKAFNEIHNLKNEDEIKIYSTNHIYVYRVQSVRKVDKNDTWVKFDGSKNMLTLSTCDSFGSKADRYVVEATYVGLVEIAGK